MHVPDGYLSPGLLLALDASAVPALALCAARSRLRAEEARAPLLGLMGAFIFAAQMVNFPVGPGTSAHLSGAALLAMLFGPFTAALVMAAILVVQALVFQDGGVTALGANFWNLAVIGSFAGYLPYWLSRRAGRRLRSAAAFLGGWLAVVLGACAVALELSWSRVAPSGLLFASLAGIHGVAGLVEGALTVAALEAIEKLAPAGARVAGAAADFVPR